MIRVHYPELFAARPEQAAIEQLATRTFELTDFLVNIAHIETLPGTFSGSVTVHDSCTGLREPGVKSQPRALLARLPGVTLREMTQPETCCGFGGTFAVKYGELSGRLADNKCEQALSATAIVAT